VLFIEHLIDEPVLNVDAARIGSGEESPTNFSKGGGL